MKKITPICVLLLCLFSCKKETKEVEEFDHPVEITAGKRCYISVRGKDTIRMSLAMNSSNANGELQFKFSEKDNSTGTLSGAFVGDTLFANYTFRSEGMKSVREMAFLNRNNTIVVGSGDMEERGDRQVFKNPRKITFEDGIVLKVSSCK